MKGEPIVVTVDASHRDAALKQETELLNIISQATYTEEKTYKECVKSKTASIPTTKFGGIHGEIEINGSLTQCVTTYLKMRSNITKASPAFLLEDTHFSKFYTFNAADEAKFKDALKGTFSDFPFFSHNVVKSSSSIVNDRDFVNTGFFHAVSAEEVIITLKGIDYAQEQAGCVRGKVVCACYKFKQLAASKTLVTQFSMADPAGKVPAGPYNKSLEGRNAILLALKDVITGKLSVE